MLGLLSDLESKQVVVRIIIRVIFRILQRVVRALLGWMSSYGIGLM